MMDCRELMERSGGDWKSKSKRLQMGKKGKKKGRIKGEMGGQRSRTRPDQTRRGLDSKEKEDEVAMGRSRGDIQK